jgi:hypothetical protein
MESRRYLFREWRDYGSPLLRTKPPAALIQLGGKLQAFIAVGCLGVHGDSSRKQRRSSSSTVMIVKLIRGLWISAQCLVVAAASSASSKSEFPPLRGLRPDLFVQAAPLVVAMACRDGVAILAAHPSPSSEPLLHYDPEEEEEHAADDQKRQDESYDKNQPFLDLPLSYSGSLRIQSVGTVVSALVTCGWRADGNVRLVNAARALAADEFQTLGEESSSILPTQLSLFMAQCAVMEGVRFIYLWCWTSYASPIVLNTR